MMLGCGSSSSLSPVRTLDASSDAPADASYGARVDGLSAADSADDRKAGDASVAISPAADAGGGVCLDAYPGIDGGACTHIGATCYFYAGTCLCVPFADSGDGSRWACQPLTEGCPSPAPTQGSACPDPGLLCEYGACIGDGKSFECGDSVWEGQAIACSP
jgi:hypothetical protein